MKPLEIDVSGPARRYISRRGGDVFVYVAGVGHSDWLVQHVKVSRPSSREFGLHEHDGLRVWLDAAFAPPARLTIRRAPWPIGPLEVTGTEAGEASASGTFEGGGSWPAHGGRRAFRGPLS